MQYDIKSMVKDGKKAKFIHYRHSELWYETECGFQFAVPVEDIGEATFLAEYKAMMLMRYIRKRIATNNEGLEETLAGVVPNCS